ncbi:cytochrome P450 3A30 [Aaosphaeria arxii CBS 175.79]|uniref:Cytochrome P450 3A30 n=1 Tax=Aaosphaeria arxii CBS 175.79 TaxID=1450172 RepID=A0A6A5XA04_9PLEO|nr:cytochrome P450 3A30 [Aaosphaeria arxii CBS 175.79]KAF2009808.1 cytochrome P450 3A30 [Aaosphaeria arxii CBS 175.79]
MQQSYALPWAALLIAASIVYFVVRLVQHRQFYKDLPKPPHDFLWGHAKLMGDMLALMPGQCHPQVAITSMAQKYNLPGLFYLDMWPFSHGMIIVQDPDLALHMTAIKNHPKHSVEKTFIDPIVGAGNIVTAEGPYWKHLHTAFAPAFSISRVRGMVGMIGEEVMIFRSILQQKAESGEVFSLEKASSCLTFDIVGKAAFGYNLGAQADWNSPALRHFGDMIHGLSMETRSWNPFKRLLGRRRRLTATKQLDSLIEKLIRQRYEELERGNIDVSHKRSLSIMDLVLRDRLEEMRKIKQSKSTALDMGFLASAVTQIKTLVLAGNGTVTDTVCFVFLLLSDNPNIVKRLREEHNQVFAPTVESTYAMLQDPQHHAKISELHLTANVIQETLRLYPVGHTARGHDENGFLTFNGVNYPTKDHMICPVSHTMHYNPEIFPRPSVFDPDRFSRNESPRHAFRSFERGSRACLGQALALDELKVILLLVIRDFDFHCDGLKPNKSPRVTWTDLDLKYGDRAFQEMVFEARPRDGMPMTVSKSV